MILIERLRGQGPFVAVVRTVNFRFGAGRLIAISIALLLVLMGMASLWDRQDHRTIIDSPVQYTITDLGNDNGRFTTVYAHAINDRGQVAGGPRAFLWENGKFKDLGTPDVCGCTAMALNNRGEIAGQLFRHPWDREPHVVILRDGRLLDTGILGSASGIDDQSGVVGRMSPPGHAFLYRNGKTVDLGALGGGFSSAEGINNRGEVVGSSSVDQWHSHAFLYSGGKMRDLGTLGGKSSFAYAINDKGWIVGISHLGSGGAGAFLYRDGKMYRMEGEMCVPRSINDSGAVVGEYQPDQETSYAIVWIGGHVHQLQDLIPRNCGWKLYDATCINNRGQITVVGIHAGERGIRSCILTPMEKNRTDLS